MKIECSGGDGWEYQKTFLIPSLGTQTLSLATSTNQPRVESLGKHTLNLTDGFSTRTLSIPAPPRFVPLMVELSQSDDLGVIPLGTGAIVHFRVMNRSEFPKEITWKTHSHQGGAMEAPTSFILEPGEVRNLEWKWVPSIPGKASVTLNFTEGSGVEAGRLTCRAHVASTISQSIEQNPSDICTSDHPVNGNAPRNEVSEMPIIPLVRDFTFKTEHRWIKGNYLVLSWVDDESARKAILAEK